MGWTMVGSEKSGPLNVNDSQRLRFDFADKVITGYGLLMTGKG